MARRGGVGAVVEEQLARIRRRAIDSIPRVFVAQLTVETRRHCRIARHKAELLRCCERFGEQSRDIQRHYLSIHCAEARQQMRVEGCR